VLEAALVRVDIAADQLITQGSVNGSEALRFIE